MSELAILLHSVLPLVSNLTRKDVFELEVILGIISWGRLLLIKEVLGITRLLFCVVFVKPFTPDSETVPDRLP